MTTIRQRMGEFRLKLKLFPTLSRCTHDLTHSGGRFDLDQSSCHSTHHIIVLLKSNLLVSHLDSLRLTVQDVEHLGVRRVPPVLQKVEEQIVFVRIGVPVANFNLNNYKVITTMVIMPLDDPT